MKSIERYWLILVIALLISCSPEGNSSSEIIEIDVLKALDDHRDFPLSKLISRVELLELENIKESYLGRPEIMYFGEKFILMYCSQRHLVFLFNRDGRFIRQIGQVGKGPGEYSTSTLSTIDPDEKIIIVVDGFRGKIISYNTDGDFLQERQYGKDTPSNMVDGISFIGPEKFGLMMRRPTRSADGYSNVILYDLNLNPSGNILPRANDDNLVYPMSRRASFGLNIILPKIHTTG